MQAVINPNPSLSRLDQASDLELGHVVRDGRLAEIKGGGEVADADRLLSPPQCGDHAQAGGLSEHLQDLSRLLSPRLVDSGQGLAAGLPGLPNG